MDDIVKAAIAKWPNVPHCYGWLSLDARGTWRMHDERAQALGLKGDPIRNTSLQDFINRNYACDDNGFWYFQNGPQRAYVDLEVTPYIAHFIPESSWILHTKIELPPINHVYLNAAGQLFFTNDSLIAMVDDRDLHYALGFLFMKKNQEDNARQNLSEDDLLAWLENTSSSSASSSQSDNPSTPFTLSMSLQGKIINVQRAEVSSLMAQKNYCVKPKK